MKEVEKLILLVTFLDGATNVLTKATVESENVFWLMA